MNNAPTDHQLINPARIAKLAGVTPSTVSNWRARDLAFPAPVAGTKARPLFSVQAVTQWLKDNDKPITQDVADTGFTAANILRGAVDAESYLPVLIPLLCWVHLGRAPHPELPEDLLLSESTANLRTLRQVARLIGSNYPQVADALDHAGRVLEGSAGDADRLLATLADVLTDTEPAGVADSLFRLATDRTRGVLSELSASPEVSALLAGLVGDDAETIADLACGTGQTLAAVHAIHPNAQLHGNDIDAQAVQLAACRLLLTGASVELTQQDSLNIDSVFDAVILHPPFGMRLTDEQLELSAQLPFGGAHGRFADPVWLQLAYRALAPGGRAVVVVPQGVLTRGGRSTEVLRGMIAADAVEAIISLPPGAQHNTNIPTCIVLLHRTIRPTTPPGVLLVDLSERSVQLTDVVRGELLTAVTTWRGGEEPQHPMSTTVPIHKLLAPDASLAPKVWVLANQPVDHEVVLARFNAAQEELQAALQELRALDSPDGGLSTLDTPVETYLIGKTFPIHRGTVEIRRSEDDLDTDLIDVLTPRAVTTGHTDKATVVRSDPRRPDVTTRAGQVAVTAVSGRIRARVCDTDGILVSRHVTLLDINPATHDPEFIAHMLMADINQATISGQTLPTVGVDKMRLPRFPLDVQQELGAKFKRLRQAEETAKQLAQKVNVLVNALINPVATGHFTTH